VHAARLVVDVEHSAADHHRDKHGQHKRTGQQIFHIFDVRVEFDDIERRLLQDAGLDGGLIQGIGQFCQFRFDRGTHEIVAIVHDHRDARMVFFVHSARKLWWDDHRAFQLAVAYIFHGLLFAVVI